jgi:hypothetical protein
LGFAYLGPCREDAVLSGEAPHAARRARELFERVRSVALPKDGTSEAARSDAAFAVIVAAAAEGRDALKAGEYASAVAAFAAAGDESEPWRRFALACLGGDASAVRLAVSELTRRVSPGDLELLARVAKRFESK